MQSGSKAKNTKVQSLNIITTCNWNNTITFFVFHPIFIKLKSQIALKHKNMFIIIFSRIHFDLIFQASGSKLNFNLYKFYIFGRLIMKFKTNVDETPKKLLVHKIHNLQYVICQNVWVLNQLNRRLAFSEYYIIIFA